MKKLLIKSLNSPAIVVMLALTVAIVPKTSYALGMGAAETRSAIGQTLQIYIPLFNVPNPDGLRFELSNLDAQTSTIQGLSAQLDRSNSQLAVLIRSEQVINEPFFNFSIAVSDSTSTVTRDFTVLFDLPQGGLNGIASTPPSSSNASSRFENDRNSYQVSDISSQGRASAPAPGSVMGPYDWAQAGQIPEKFGPVLDGQSLWRVARRINRAMGVSLEQMMWGLYQANPQAFSTTAIESLRAGVTLTIPSEAQVKTFSRAQAISEMAALSSPALNGTSQQEAVASAAEPATSSAPDSPIDEFADSGESDLGSAFQLTGIDQSAEAAQANSQQSQDIILNLSETVGNLSQELIRKDQQINILEGQVEELKRFIIEEGNEPPAFGDIPVAAATSESSDVQESDEQITNGLSSAASTSESPVGTESTPEGSQSSSTALDSQLANQQSGSFMTKWWPLALIALLFGALYSLRHRLASLFRSLNIGGQEAELEFDRRAGDEREFGAKEAPTVYKDYSVMESVKRKLDSNELAEGISYLDLAEPDFEPELDGKQPLHDEDSDFDNDIELASELEFDTVADGDSETAGKNGADDGSYVANEVLIIEEESFISTEEVEEEDLTFDDRFGNLLAEKDFDFARELLDFARYNEINDDRYHCERLRLLKSMEDEDGFYEYYYQIESKIPDFPANLQTEISQFVVQLAQNG